MQPRAAPPPRSTALQARSPSARTPARHPPSSPVARSPRASWTSACGALACRALEPQLDSHRVDLADRPANPALRPRRRHAPGCPSPTAVRPRVHLARDRARSPTEAAGSVAAELRRVGRGWFVSARRSRSPIEPHSLLPRGPLLPPRLRRAYCGGSAPPSSGRRCASAPAQIEALFGPARPSGSGPRLVKELGGRPARQPAAVVAHTVDHQKHSS